MRLSTNAVALIGLTGIVAALVSVVVFALLKFLSAARATRRGSKQGGEMVILSAALEEAVNKMKAQERAMAARAEASERLSEEIITSLTAGLLVVGLQSEVRILNPVGRRLLGVPDAGLPGDYHQVLAEPLAQMIDACLANRIPILRRRQELQECEDHDRDERGHYPGQADKRDGVGGKAHVTAGASRDTRD